MTQAFGLPAAIPAAIPLLLAPPPRTIVLVGLMGAGKSAVGRLLADRLGVPLRDADHEIEYAAGMSIPEIFDIYGEPAFRDGERRVIARLLKEPAHVLATGGGAYMNDETRAAIRQSGLSVWLRAGLDELLCRTARRNNRPLLAQGDPRAVMKRLIAERHPVYANADIVVDSGAGTAEETTTKVLDALATFLEKTA